MIWDGDCFSWFARKLLAMKSLLIILIFAVFLPVNFAEDGVVILTKDVTEESPIELSCGNVTSLGENDTVTWIYVNASDVKETLESQRTTVNMNITDSTATGEYSCSLNDEVKASYLAAKIVKPEIKNGGKSITYNDGDMNRKITCEATGSYPDPIFTWLRRGDLEGEALMLVMSETNSNFFITVNGTKSVLLIYNVTYDDASTYICNVTNVAGFGIVEVLVRVKNRYAAIWPFIGIVTEVVTLIAIIFLYERHSKKKDSKKELVVMAEDEKPLNRDEGMEVRNRNGGKSTED